MVLKILIFMSIFIECIISDIFFIFGIKIREIEELTQAPFIF